MRLPGVRRQHVQTFWHQKWREARLRPCSNPLRSPLLPPFEIYVNWSCTNAHKIRRQTLQYHKTQSKNQGVWDHPEACSLPMTQQSPHTLKRIYSIWQACKDFGLIISLKKSNVLGQDVDTPPVITINNYELEVLHQFTYLGSTISDNLSLDVEINKSIRKAATTLGRLTSRVWEKPKLTTPTKTALYYTYIVITILYRSEIWTTYAKQEQKVNSFHMQCLCRIFGISWRDKVPNA